MKKGIFIVFEGADRSGKTTQAKLLAEYLNKLGKKTLHTREPGGTGFAEAIRKILLDPRHKVLPIAELFLYEAARAQHTGEKILPSLNGGKVVICERYSMSTSAYQGYGRGLSLKIIKPVNDTATSKLKPDLTVLFHMPDSQFAKRSFGIKADRLEKESAKFRARVRAGYLAIAKKQPKTIVIDAAKPIDEIQQLLRAKIGGLMK
ncbi:MAG: dTMP kinase [Elusimicrobia bacterium]|nr:dTMP kinase [Elusimicrobiota bacterium]